MMYWLFTEGRALLSAFLIPLGCLTLLAPIIATAILGAGIQRTDDHEPDKPSMAGWVAVFFAVIGVTAIFLHFAGDFAIQTAARRPTGGNTFLNILIGAPATVDQNRLMLFSFGLLMLQVVVGMGLRNGMKNGGWLHERVDRLRNPQNKRGGNATRLKITCCVTPTCR